MPVEIFGIAEFEKALELKNGTRIFENLGLDNGEYVFAYTRDKVGMRLVVRSSIGPRGVSAECGEDSIRLWLETYHNGKWRSIGKGPDAYTTRVKGWQTRLMTKIKEVNAKMMRVKWPAPEGCKIVYSTKEANLGRPCAIDTDGRWVRWLDGC